MHRPAVESAHLFSHTRAKWKVDGAESAGFIRPILRFAGNPKSQNGHGGIPWKNTTDGLIYQPGGRR